MLKSVLVRTPEEVFQRALARLQENDLAAVERELLRLVDRPDGDEMVRLLRGAIALRRGNPALAADHLLKVDPDGPLRKPLLPLAGNALFQLDRSAEAEAFLRPAADESPEDPGLHRLLAAIYYDWGDMNAARERLETLARLAPRDERPWRLLGQIHLDFEQYEDAVRCAREAIDRLEGRPADELLVKILATALLRLNRYEEARAALAGAAGAPALKVLDAEALWRLDDAAAASTILDDLLSKEPGRRDASVLRARMHLDERGPAAAIPLVDAVLQVDPHDHEARRLLGQALMQSGDLDRGSAELARAEQEQAIKLKIAELNLKAIDHPADAQLRDEISRACRDAGLIELAERWARAAADLRKREQIAASQGSDARPAAVEPDSQAPTE